MYQYVVYRAKKDKTGVATQFTIDRDLMFLKMAKQQPTDNDSFAWTDSTKSVNVKLGITDVGKFLVVMQGLQQSDNIYHEFEKEGHDKVVTNINLAQYSKDATDKQGKPVTLKGVSLGIIRGGEKYGVVLTPGEIEVVLVMLKEAVLAQTWKEDYVKGNVQDVKA